LPKHDLHKKGEKITTYSPIKYSNKNILFTTNHTSKNSEGRVIEKELLRENYRNSNGEMKSKLNPFFCLCLSYLNLTN
jgi:hypothetical protein